MIVAFAQQFQMHVPNVDSIIHWGMLMNVHHVHHQIMTDVFFVHLSHRDAYDVL